MSNPFWLSWFICLLLWLSILSPMAVSVCVCMPLKETRIKQNHSANIQIAFVTHTHIILIATLFLYFQQKKKMIDMNRELKNALAWMLCTRMCMSHQSTMHSNFNDMIQIMCMHTSKVFYFMLTPFSTMLAALYSMVSQWYAFSRIHFMFGVLVRFHALLILVNLALDVNTYSKILTPSQTMTSKRKSYAV